MSRLTCIDVDSTLVTETQKTPVSAREAVRVSVAAGSRFLLSTGYSLPEIYPFLRNLNFHGIIAGSRVYMKIGEEIVMDRRVSVEEISYIIDIYHKHGINWMWQGPGELYTGGGFFGSFTGAPSAEGNPWHPHHLQILPILNTKAPMSTSKGLFVLPYDLLVSYEESVEVINPEYHIVPDSIGAAERVTGELLLAGLTKGVDIRVVAKYLGSNIAGTVMIDDSPSDIEILRAARISVAMDSVTDAVESHADLMTSATDGDGICWTPETLNPM